MLLCILLWSSVTDLLLHLTLIIYWFFVLLIWSWSHFTFSTLHVYLSFSVHNSIKKNLKCVFLFFEYGKLLNVFWEDRYWIINEVDKKIQGEKYNRFDKKKSVNGKGHCMQLYFCNGLPKTTSLGNSLYLSICNINKL